MNSTAELIVELDAEQQTLDELVGSLSDEQWSLPTPAAGWQIRHQVAHLAFFDTVGASCVSGDPSPLYRIRDNVDGRTEDEASLALLQPLLGLAPRDLLDEWRSARARLREEFLAAPPERKVVWGAGPMAVPSFVTARLMETWAHGLDCFAAAGVAPVDTDRIRHVCRLGYRALPYAFRRAGRSMPGVLDDLRMELIGPSGEEWVFGPQSAANIIRGPAGQWARLAVQRIPLSAARKLTAEGDLAELALLVARAFA